MKYDVMSQTAKLLQQYKKNKRWLTVFLCLAVTVVLGTLAALKLYGQAMTHKVKVLECKYEVHEHTEECYDKENAEELICVYADYVVHMHNDDCYDADGKLVCPLEETEVHEHTEDCYEEVKVLVCEEETAEITEGENTEAEIAEGENAAQNNEAVQEPVKGDLICTQEEHVHSDACYSEALICTAEEHTHGDECLDEEGNLICTLEEHTHGEDCYGREFVCTAEEHAHQDECYQWIIPEEVKEPETEEPTTEEPTEEAHVHTDACYVTEKVLKCGKLELHTHTDECYAKESFDEEGKLIEGSLPICGLLQLEEHVHGEDCFVTVELTPEEVEALKGGATLHIHEESCYDEEGNLVCGHEATHIHVPECYDDAGKVICGYGTGTHVHEKKCYDEEGNLICGYETAAHPHVESCYDAEGNLQCGYETASHVHEAGCYDEEGNVVCGYETAAHVHGKECYDENGILICGYETARHMHEESCYDAEGNLICGYNADGLAASALYCDESIHAHDAECYDADQALICGKADFAVHTHTDNCYNINGVLICPLPEVEAHVHGAECYPEGTAEGGAEPVCGKEEVRLHAHTEECHDENGVLVCGQLEILEHVHSEACTASNQPVTKTFESESFIVTAVYKPDANIPEEAELIAEQITEESDSEHYAKRQAEYQEALGDNKATMRALLKIGFYVNGEEVEPESPVTLTIQFLDENGLAEGKSVTVIHFAEEGTEVLEGSEVEDGSTTFEMTSFSEIAVGDGQKSVRVPINEELTYETDEFEVTFHIEGEVSVPVGNAKSEEETGMEEETDESGDSAENETEESGAGEGAVTDDAEAGTEDAEASEGSENDEAAADRGTEDNGDMDAAIAEGGVSVIIENDVLEKILEFRVDPLSEEAEEYAKAAAAVYADGTDGGEELDDQLFLQVLSYRVLYDGQKLDLSDCVVTAEVKPSEALVEYAETALDPMTLELDGEEQIADGLEVKPEVVLSVAEPKEDAGEGTLLNAMVVGQEQMMAFTVSNSNAGIMTIAGTSQANPEFIVQYYAYINVIEKTSTTPGGIDVLKDLVLIDTSGGVLPQNGVKDNMPLLKVNLNTEGRIQSKQNLIEVYAEKRHHYITSPSLVYFNRLTENRNYELNQIWVLKPGKDKTSVNEDDWETFDFRVKEWHFTNKTETWEQDKENFILISEGAVIRLVCDVTKDEQSNDTKFFDYDISDGKLYNKASAKPTNIVERNALNNDSNSSKWYMYTEKQGINSNLENQNFAFGNGEGTVKTTLGDVYWNKNQLNKANSNSYNDCTFGLVTGLDANGNIQYASGVFAPNLFDDGDAKGKSSYDGSLTFHREGDTYTLVAANVGNGGREELDKFHDRLNWNKSKRIWSNHFWPMDNVASAGTNGHDLMFSKDGRKDKLLNFNNAGETLSAPVSDDDNSHNHYFGMKYTVDFELTEDYIGPLEYIFYGDDDMWVFLDGENINGKLICDIGGVHSSVGEYVNLWDHIEKGSSGHYTLSFFFTERGASGSTCWMQFTLPSVSFRTPEQTTGMLRVDKEVVGENNDYEFGFRVEFSDKDGNPLKDDYSYSRYTTKEKETDENGVERDKKIKDDILIWNNGNFQLKEGEYVIISYLPIGTKYTITEVGPVEYDENTGEYKYKGNADNYNASATGDGVKTNSSSEGNSNNADKRVITGEINKTSQHTVKYVNAYKYALPETGGSGTILYTIAGAIVLLGGAGFLYKRKFRERRV